MSVTSYQLRAARALKSWSLDDLEALSGVSRQTIYKFENGKHRLQRDTEAALMKVLENQGIELIDDRGVALKNDQMVTLSGENVFFRLLDDVIATLRDDDNAEALFACIVDRLSPPVVIENYRRLRSAGIKMRSLVKEGDTYLMGSLDEYRCLPVGFFHNNTTVIYKDKFATMILDPETGNDAGAMIIRNPHIASAQRNLFNLVWSNAPTPSTTTADVRYDE